MYTEQKVLAIKAIMQADDLILAARMKLIDAAILIPEGHPAKLLINELMSRLYKDDAPVGKIMEAMFKTPL